MMTDAVRMTMHLKPMLQEYHTRQQRIDFSMAYGNIVKPPLFDGHCTVI